MESRFYSFNVLHISNWNQKPQNKKRCGPSLRLTVVFLRRPLQILIKKCLSIYFKQNSLIVLALRLRYYRFLKLSISEISILRYRKITHGWFMVVILLKSRGTAKRTIKKEVNQSASVVTSTFKNAGCILVINHRSFCILGILYLAVL